MLVIPFHFVKPYRILIHFYIPTFRIQKSVCIFNWEEIARIWNCGASQTVTNRSRTSRSVSERSWLGALVFNYLYSRTLCQDSQPENWWRSRQVRAWRWLFMTNVIRSHNLWKQSGQYWSCSFYSAFLCECCVKTAQWTLNGFCYYLLIYFILIFSKKLQK